MKTKIGLGIALALFVNNVVSNECMDNTAKRQEQLQASFSNLEISEFKESPISDLFEVTTGNRIVYYYPQKELIVFGEIYDKNGTSLTQQSLNESNQKKLKNLPMDSGIIIGDPFGKEIIEFMDPECAYCRRQNQFLNELSKENQIKRIIYFVPRKNVQSLKKVSHIICSKNKQKAFNEIFDGKIKTYKSCRQAEEVLEKHLKISEMLGVNATPSILIGNQISIGFQPGKILKLLGISRERQ